MKINIAQKYVKRVGLPQLFHYIILSDESKQFSRKEKLLKSEQLSIRIYYEN